MIRNVQVNNYKSIPSLNLDLGRVTVLVGANGSGKSNILEAIALGSAAAQNKLDNEFLISRGIRVTETRFMRSAFEATPIPSEPLKVAVQGDNRVAFDCEIVVDESRSYPKWRQDLASVIDDCVATEMRHIEPLDQETIQQTLRDALASRPDIIRQLLINKAGPLSGFLVYAPENSALRTFQGEGQILPLGIRGEGLFAHLKALNSDKNRDRLVRIKEALTLIDWFESFDIPEDLGPGERSIRIRDRFLPEGAFFDQRTQTRGSYSCCSTSRSLSARIRLPSSRSITSILPLTPSYAQLSYGKS